MSTEMVLTLHRIHVDTYLWVLLEKKRSTYLLTSIHVQQVENYPLQKYESMQFFLIFITVAISDHHRSVLYLHIK